MGASFRATIMTLPFAAFGAAALVDGVTGHDIQRDRFAGEGFDKDASTVAQH